MLNKRLIVITGPTATGKTALGVQVAKALNGEIISCDSMQIYRGMDIGTAKVKEIEKQGVPHYMIDVADPAVRFTVADFSSMALPIVEDIFTRGRVPILVGGTGMYINSILFDMTFSTYNEEERLSTLKYAENKTNQEIWDELFALDPQRANQLSVNDIHRTLRALEVAKCGSTTSKQNELEKPRYNADIYVLTGDRALLYDRINKRVDIMVQSGVEQEVQTLIRSGLTDSHQSFGAIAYKELYAAMKKGESREEMLSLIKQRSRNYAKRQWTWCRKYYPNATWIPFNEPENNLQIIVSNYEKHSN